MKRLGKSNFKVSDLGMGCFALGGPFKGANGNYYAYGTVNDEESKKMLHRAIELGINFFDTADVYGCGHSERILGSVLSEYNRPDFVIATKFANEFDEQTKTVIGKNVDPEYIRKALDASLERLQTDYIDLYQLHSSDHDVESARNILSVLEDFVSEGKIKGFGWSTDSVERAKVFTESKNCIGIQYAIHLTRANPQMIELCEQYDLAGIIRSPLGSGTLTGKYSEGFTKSLPRDHMWYNLKFPEEESFKKRQVILNQIQDLLDEEGDGRSLVQALLSYLWSTSDTTIPIPGAKTLGQLEENAATIEYGPLKPEILAKINDMVKEVRTYV